MFFVQFLRDQISPDDRAMLDFVEYMVPKLFEIYADTSAKGGDHSRNLTVDEETRKKFEAKDDQSMVSHLLNGVFPTMRLLTILEEEGLSQPPFSDLERRIYILSYLMHDVDKILRHDAVLQGCESVEQFETRGREQIERAKSIVSGYLQDCSAEKFLPNYTDYLEEITYLVVNTQQQWGTHLHTYLWEFRLKERRILLLRDLCRYSDLIAYLVPSPSAILLSDDAKKLTTILAGLSKDELVFCYHQLREARGLLTNVVNTGLIHLFTEGREGIWTYLFFSDGVVYIKRKSLALSISTEQIVDVVQNQLRQICAGVIKKDAPGFKFSIQGIAKHPAYYYEFISLEEYTELLAHFTIWRTNNDITAIPLQKLRQMQENREIAADLSCDFTPDKRIGMFSRFLSIVFNTLLGSLDKKQQELREQVEKEVVRVLDLILPCLLSKDSQMGKIRHRAKILGIRLKLHEPVTEDLDNFIEGIRIPIGKVFFSQFIPKVLNRIQFRAICRLRKKTNIFRNNQISRLMPARLINLHHNKIRGKVLTNLFEEDIHHFCIGIRENQKGHFS